VRLSARRGRGEGGRKVSPPERVRTSDAVAVPASTTKKSCSARRGDLGAGAEAQGVAVLESLASGERLRQAGEGFFLDPGDELVGLRWSDRVLARAESLSRVARFSTRDAARTRDFSVAWTSW